MPSNSTSKKNGKIAGGRKENTGTKMTRENVVGETSVTESISYRFFKDGVTYCTMGKTWNESL